MWSVPDCHPGWSRMIQNSSRTRSVISWLSFLGTFPRLGRFFFLPFFIALSIYFTPLHYTCALLILFSRRYLASIQLSNVCLIEGLFSSTHCFIHSHITSRPYQRHEKVLETYKSRHEHETICSMYGLHFSIGFPCPLRLDLFPISVLCFHGSYCADLLVFVISRPGVWCHVALNSRGSSYQHLRYLFVGTPGPRW